MEEQVIDRYCTSCRKDVEAPIAIWIEAIIQPQAVKVVAQAYCPECKGSLCSGAETIELT